MEEKVNEFQKNRGVILSHASDIEQFLEFFISNYFVRPQNQKTFFFESEVVQKISFEKKTELFNEICKREKYNEDKLNEVLKSIRFVQELRNKVAHSPMLIDSYQKKVSLMKRKRLEEEPNFLELTKDLMDKVAKEREKANEGILEFHSKYHNGGTIDKVQKMGLE